MDDDNVIYDENGIGISGMKKGYRQSIPGSMGLIPIDLRRYKKEGKYWEKDLDRKGKKSIKPKSKRKIKKCKCNQEEL
jgi:hypothetical protein